MTLTPIGDGTNEKSKLTCQAADGSATAVSIDLGYSTTSLMAANICSISCPTAITNANQGNVYYWMFSYDNKMKNSAGTEMTVVTDGDPFDSL